MARFRYRFATILKHKKSREEETLRSLGAAQRNYQEALAYKRMLQQQLQNALIRREKLGQIPVSALDFELENNYIVGTKQRITQSEQAIFRANKGVEKALRAYLTARKQTQMFEALYDKDHREWRIEQAKKEQKRLDDMVIMRQHLAEGQLSPANASKETDEEVAS